MTFIIIIISIGRVMRSNHKNIFYLLSVPRALRGQSVSANLQNQIENGFRLNTLL